MKKLIIPLFFLLTLSISVNASPWSQMLKGGLKEGLKNNQSTNNKKSKFESFTYKVTDQDTYDASISLEYDSFTGETKCKYPQILLPMILELDGYLDTRRFPNKGNPNKASLYIRNERGKRQDKITKYRLDNGSIQEFNPNEIVEIPYRKWKRHKELKLRTFYSSFSYTDIYGKKTVSTPVTKDFVIYLNELDRFVKDKRRYGCND